jgi:hypothetical protein
MNAFPSAFASAIRTITLGAGLSVATLIGGCNLFEPAMVGVCEQALQQRLRSPTGYKRINVSHYETPLNRQQFEQKLAGEPPANRTMALWGFDNGTTKPTHIQVFLTYDAPNAYGTPVREAAMCEYTKLTEVIPRPDNVLINGKTNFQWIAERLPQ